MGFRNQQEKLENDYCIFLRKGSYIIDAEGIGSQKRQRDGGRSENRRGGVVRQWAESALPGTDMVN